MFLLFMAAHFGLVSSFRSYPGYVFVNPVLQQLVKAPASVAIDPRLTATIAAFILLYYCLFVNNDIEYLGMQQSCGFTFYLFDSKGKTFYLVIY